MYVISSSHNHKPVSGVNVRNLEKVRNMRKLAKPSLEKLAKLQ